ncbi:unnamed protein product [Bursaphelenchus okinawaensis]|uniref:FHA domain-containing protein n=1 Tax=Bursaphelenchus okinawaensis TaxID=465554 RepID=A0A811K557_9BILA|nr:unnamed protein product [Bursaphelenchus okinawaensis]CAG9091561.1 unnamed protein product [Bursaphelenchus okinawaensis]
MIELRPGDVLTFGDKEFQFQMPAINNVPITNQTVETGTVKRNKLSRRAQSTGGLARMLDSNANGISLPVVGEKIHPHNFSERFNRIPIANQRLCKIRAEPVPRLCQTGKSLSQVADEPMELAKNVGRKPPKSKISEISGNRSGDNSCRSDWYNDGSNGGSIDSSATHSTGNQLVHRVIRLQNELHRKELEVARLKESASILPKLSNGDAQKRNSLDNAALSVIRINELVYQTFFVVSCKELQDISQRLTETALKNNGDIFGEAYKMLQEPFSFRLMEVNSKCGIIFEKSDMSQDEKEQLFDKFDHFFSDQLNPISKAVDSILPVLREASQLARESLRAESVFSQWAKDFASQLQLQPGWDIMEYRVDDLLLKFKNHNLGKHWLPQVLVPILKVMIYENRNLAEEIDRQGKDHSRALRALTEKLDEIQQALDKERTINSMLQENKERSDLVRELQNLRIENQSLMEKLRLYEERRTKLLRSKSQGEPTKKRTTISSTTVPYDIETRIMRDASLESRIPTPGKANGKDEDGHDTVSSCSRCSIETEVESSHSLQVDERTKVSSVKNAVGEWEKRQDNEPTAEETYASTLISNITKDVTGRLANAVIGGVATGVIGHKTDVKHDNGGRNVIPEINELGVLSESSSIEKKSEDGVVVDDNNPNQPMPEVADDVNVEKQSQLQEEPYNLKYEMLEQQMARKEDENDVNSDKDNKTLNSHHQGQDDISEGLQNSVEENISKSQMAHLGMENSASGVVDDKSQRTESQEDDNQSVSQQSSHKFFEEDTEDDETIREVKDAHRDLEQFENQTSDSSQMNKESPEIDDDARVKREVNQKNYDDADDTVDQYERQDDVSAHSSPKSQNSNRNDDKSNDSEAKNHGEDRNNVFTNDVNKVEVNTDRKPKNISRENSSSKIDHAQALAEEYNALHDHNDRQSTVSEVDYVIHDKPINSFALNQYLNSTEHQDDEVNEDEELNKEENYSEYNDDNENDNDEIEGHNNDNMNDNDPTEQSERKPSVVDEEGNGEWKEFYDVIRQASTEEQKPHPIERRVTEPAMLENAVLEQPESARSGCTKRAESAEVLMSEDVAVRKDTKATNEDVEDEILDEEEEEEKDTSSKRKNAFEFWELAKVLAEALSVDLPNRDDADFTAIDQDEGFYIERHRREIAVDTILDKLREILHKIRRQDTIMSRQTSIRSVKSIDEGRKHDYDNIEGYRPINGGVRSPPIAEQFE